MFEGHNPYLVALSVMIAIIGGYTGFGLAARVRGTPGVARRVLLAGAAAFLAVSIWTMHFTGMMAAPIRPDAAYLVLPTILSFLICVLVVGVSLFFVSIGQPTDRRVMAAAVLLGAGIVSMHYVGVEALTGNFHMEHDLVFIALAVLIAIGAAYGGLRIFLARHGGARLAFSAIAFGIAVSGMHYTAMAGMRFAPGREYCLFASDGLVASPQILSLVVMLLCFAIGGGFLLLLVPEPRSQVSVQLAGSGPAGVFPGWNETLAEATTDDSGSISAHAQRPLPLGGLGQPPPQLAARLPVEGADGVYFIEAAHIRSIRADAHYTKVHDGSRERMSPWSISEAEENLDPAFFMRVHRSHIIAISHVAFVRKEGEGAVVELDGPVRHLVPVSRARTAELRARLGLTRRNVDSA